MTYYYIMINEAPGYIKLTKEEFMSMSGEEPYSSYASKLYRNKISISDVPEEYREIVNELVSNKIKYRGVYSDPTVS